MSDDYSPSKILVVGPAWVGDMIMAQTLFKWLVAQCPGVIIDVLAPNATKSLVECMPEVRHSIILPVNHGRLDLWQRYELGCHLRQEKYDQAIVLPNSFKSALVPFLAKIPKRTGWHREFRFLILNDARRLKKADLPLMIERFMALGFSNKEFVSQQISRHLSPKALEVYWPSLQISDAQVKNALKKHNLMLSSQPILALCPGAEFGPAKRWPAEYFAQVAEVKAKEGWQVWLLGAKGDRIIADEIQQKSHHACVDLLGKTTLVEAVALLSIVTVVVSNDSGLMHMSAAVNRPLVALYGSTTPKFTPPLSKKVKALSLNLMCSPCFKRHCPLNHFKCMRDMLPEKVLYALDELMRISQ